MLKQKPQSAVLLRNRFAAWVGVLGLIAAGTFMFNANKETNLAMADHIRGQETAFKSDNEAIQFDQSDLVELQLENDAISLALSHKAIAQSLEEDWENLIQDSSGELQIVDSQGHTVFDQTVEIKNGSIESDFRQYPEGTYEVRLRLEDRLIRKKIHKK